VKRVADAARVKAAEVVAEAIAVQEVVDLLVNDAYAAGDAYLASTLIEEAILNATAVNDFEVKAAIALAALSAIDEIACVTGLGHR
jgi:hypothetical protein